MLSIIKQPRALPWAGMGQAFGLFDTAVVAGQGGEVGIGLIEVYAIRDPGDF